MNANRPPWVCRFCQNPDLNKTSAVIFPVRACRACTAELFAEDEQWNPYPDAPAGNPAPRGMS
jgi:pyruvate-formate lyase-activating enzyme